MQTLIDENNDVLLYQPGFIKPAEAWELFAALQQQIAWHQERLILFGREVAVPRLVAWYGDRGANYRYSGVNHEPLPWLHELEDWRRRLQQQCGQHFNSVLLNLYRDGQDSMGWHRDAEPELGPEPWIASLSLGQARRFKLRCDSDGRTLDIDLKHGDLLLMGGQLQRHWRHCLPKSKKTMGPRINLTYRQVALSGP